MKEILKKFIPLFLLNWYHWSLPMFGALLYRFPSKKIKVIGVVGTDGKTTTTSLIVSILEQAGYKVASISTIRFKIGDKEWKNTLKMTMPGRIQVQQFLKDAVRTGCQYAVLEVTDEGIKQHRHRFIDFKTAVLTNITPEHIEAHGSFEKMRAENEKLFQITKKVHIINLDDENAKYFLKYPAKKKYLYKIKNQKSKIKITNQNSKVLEVIENFEFNLKLLGKFNIYNALAATCVGLSQGVSLEICKKALEKIEGVLGRMEVVIREPFTVIVDYAHTVNALEKVYQTIQQIKKQDAKIIAVFGSCGGGRDRWKRPEFGKIAAKYCDEIILTNEDPYDENPSQILSQIKSGIQNTKHPASTRCQGEAGKIQNTIYEIIDRREAIRKALTLANPGDVVIITGKGREPWICVANNKKIPWDDKKVVIEEFEKIKTMRKGVNIIILDNKNRVLVLKRSIKVKISPNLWNLPGGNVKKGESLKQAVIREAKEETNLKIKPVDRHFYVHYYPEVTVYAFKTKLTEGKISLDKTHVKFRWVSKDNWKDLKYTPGVRATLKELFK